MPDDVTPPAVPPAAPPAVPPAVPPAAPPAAPPAVPPAAPPAAPPAVPPAATADKQWWDGVTEEPIREYARAKGYKDGNEALKAAWSANQMNKLEPAITAVLEGKATPEQETAFYNKLGRPESPDSYDLKPADGVSVNDSLVSMAKSMFHKLGASQAKAQGAFDEWNAGVTEMNAKNMAEERAKSETDITTLETKWGGDLDKNKAAGLRAIQALGLNNELIDGLQKHMGYAPVVELLAMLGRKSDEGGFINTNTNNTDPNNTSAMTPEQAKARIAVLSADTEFQKSISTAKHPMRVANLAVWESLHAKAG